MKRSSSSSRWVLFHYFHIISHPKNRHLYQKATKPYGPKGSCTRTKKRQTNPVLEKKKKKKNATYIPEEKKNNSDYNYTTTGESYNPMDLLNTGTFMPLFN